MIGVSWTVKLKMYTLRERGNEAVTRELEERLEAVRARLDSQIEAARATRDAFASNAEDLRSVQSTYRSDFGDCEVTANAEGAILRVKLPPRAGDAQTLETILVDTITRAQRSAREAAAQRAASLLGESSPLVAHLRSTHRTGA